MTAAAIRTGVPADHDAIAALYREAFPEEDLLPLLCGLLAGDGVLSLVAAGDDERVVGHVAFTDCAVAGDTARAALLGPLAVAGERQGRGIGSALVRAGLDRLAAAGPVRVFVLGDPTYYARFGFAPEAGIASPYPLPGEWAGAWQSLALGGAGPAPSGRLSVPPVWDDPALWAA
ncbi:N-acetyltransferase [Rhodobacteraceae bacterium WD3A24]|nr:N-acetyltransferase [Rhodobacteraceae bacterium WD3A24]